VNDSPLEMTILADGADVVVRLTGELDITAEDVLLPAVAAFITERPDTQSVCIDLTDVSFVDSSGLRSLLLCRQHADEVGVSCELTVVDGPVTRLLALSGLDTYFAFRPPRAVLHRD